MARPLDDGDRMKRLLNVPPPRPAPGPHRADATGRVELAGARRLPVRRRRPVLPVPSAEKSREQAAEAKAVCARDSREYRRPWEHPLRPIHDCSSSVFPLPGGADNTVTEAGARAARIARNGTRLLPCPDERHDRRRHPNCFGGLSGVMALGIVALVPAGPPSTPGPGSRSSSGNGLPTRTTLATEGVRRNRIVRVIERVQG
jgi:hypothetical protein